jgi:hypothetical protein
MAVVAKWNDMYICERRVTIYAFDVVFESRIYSVERENWWFAFTYSQDKRQDEPGGQIAD